LARVSQGKELTFRVSKPEKQSLFACGEVLKLINEDMPI
jgi:hypothetical protein